MCGRPGRTQPLSRAAGCRTLALDRFSLSLSIAYFVSPSRSRARPQQIVHWFGFQFHIWPQMQIVIINNIFGACSRISFIFPLEKVERREHQSDFCAQNALRVSIVGIFLRNQMENPKTGRLLLQPAICAHIQKRNNEIIEERFFPRLRSART